MIHLSFAASETQAEKNLEIPHPNAMSHGLRVITHNTTTKFYK